MLAWHLSLQRYSIQMFTDDEENKNSLKMVKYLKVEVESSKKESR